MFYQEENALNIYLDLFLTFAKVGVCTFGGGYAMLPILEREIVDNKGWATKEELTDYFAIGQCTPGIIAVNVATFIGHKYRGDLGGTVATFGVVTPSVIIIALIASVLSSAARFPVVNHALAGVNACVIALIVSSVLKLGKSAIRDRSTALIYLAVLGAAVLLGASPVILVLLAGVAGRLVRSLKRLHEKEETK